MWFAVKTRHGEEEKVREQLVGKIDIVRDAFLPKKSKWMRGANGKQCFHTAPLINGIVFADLRADLPAEAPRMSSKDFYHAIWEGIRPCVTPRGYFYYHDTGTKDIQYIAGAHLISGDPQTTSPDKFIPDSRIPDKEMEVFMSFMGDTAVETEDIQIVSKSFQELAQVNDIVRVLSGPWAGIEGVVVQKQCSSGGHKVKDRHLEVRFGRSHCLSLSNARRFNLAIIRKAQEGDKARLYRLWREADHLIGLIQRDEVFRDDAPMVLRRAVTTIINQRSVSMDSVLQAVGQLTHNDEEARHLFTFATALPSEKGKTLEQTIAEYIPSYPIRPFLTPSIGAEAYHNFQTVLHRDFKELVVPVNLQSWFVAPGRAEDFAYNAHVAVFTSGAYKGKAIVSWGSFFDIYDSLSPAQREGFMADLQQKGYSLAHALFSTGRPLHSDGSEEIAFTRIGGIGGFAMDINGNELEAAQALVNAVAPVAVEFWQNERLRRWRQCVHQTVLIDRPAPPSR